MWVSYLITGSDEQASLQEPQVLVVGDLDDVFLPLPEDLLVSLNDSRAVITSLLQKLPAMFRPTQNVKNALAKALQFSYKMLVCFSHSLYGNNIT